MTIFTFKSALLVTSIMQRYIDIRKIVYTTCRLVVRHSIDADCSIIHACINYSDPPFYMHAVSS